MKSSRAGAMGEAVYWDVFRAVPGVLYWAMARVMDVDVTVDRAVFAAMSIDPRHPAIDDFLIAAGAGTP